MILILDDEPWYIQAYKDTLELEGISVKIVQNARDFFSALKNPGELQAIVIDVMLSPGIDAGVEILEKFRVKHPKLPAILLTNRGDIEQSNYPCDLTRVLCKRDTTPTDMLSTLRNMGVT